jgi:hypothetical protein
MKPVKPEECRVARREPLAANWSIAPSHQSAPRRAGILHRIVRAITRVRARQAERDIARQFFALGGRMTDETERKLMERIISGRLF